MWVNMLYIKTHLEHNIQATEATCVFLPDPCSCFTHSATRGNHYSEYFTYLILDIFFLFLYKEKVIK